MIRERFKVFSIANFDCGDSIGKFVSLTHPGLLDGFSLLQHSARPVVVGPLGRVVGLAWPAGLWGRGSRRLAVSGLVKSRGLVTNAILFYSASGKK